MYCALISFSIMSQSWVLWSKIIDMQLLELIEASLSEPHIDHDNSPRAWNNDIYVYITYPMFVAPWLLRSMYGRKASCISVYWRAHMHDSQLHALDWLDNKDNWSHSCLPWRSMKTGRWMHRHGINGLSLLRQWNCSCPATCQRTCVNSETTDGLTVVLDK